MNGRFGRVLVVLFTVLWGFTAFNGLFGMFGCGGRPRAEDLFFYRSESVEAKISLECNGVSSRFEYRGQGNECRVEFTAPDELCGFALELTDEGGRVIFDGLNAEAPESLCTVPDIMRSVFSLSPEDVTAIETAPHPEIAGEKVTRVSAGEITVTLNGDGLPIYAEGMLFGVQFYAEISDLAVIREEKG